MSASAPPGKTRARRGTRKKPPTPPAVVAHEIRGPLGVVMTLAEMLLERPLADHDRETVELVRLAGAHALAVAEDLVADAGIETGRFRPVSASMSPAGVAREVAALWSPLAGTGRTVTARVAAGTPDHIRSDARRLRQILFNLVSNATRHADRGAVTVSVSPGDGGVLFEVRDRGSDPHMHAADTSPPASDTSADAGGLGIGLWISERLAGALGGRLDIGPAPGGGTLARLEIPVAPPKPAASRPKRQRSARAKAKAADVAADPGMATPEAAAPRPASVVPAAPRPTRDWPLARRQALVVDDSAVSRMLMTAMLSSFDMSVTTVACGRDAEAFVATCRPDVVLLDWSLAGETGHDVLDRLAARLGDAMPPVVMVTAEARSPLAGVAGHLRKPFSPRELFEVLTGALAPKASVAAAR